MTLVALTVAVASIPGSSPSSSAASRVINDTTRCGPAWISTSAETLSFVTFVMTPGNELRRLVCDGAGSMDAAKSAGKLRVEGKDYVVQEGDILNVRFAV